MNIPLQPGQSLQWSAAWVPGCLILFLLLIIYPHLLNVAPRCEALRVGLRVSTGSQGFEDVTQLVNAAENAQLKQVASGSNQASVVVGASRVTDLEVDVSYARDSPPKWTVSVVVNSLVQAASYRSVQPNPAEKNRLFLITLPSTGTNNVGLELLERSSADAILSSLTSLHFGHLTQHADEDEGKEPAMQRRDSILYSTSQRTLMYYALMHWIGFRVEMRHLKVESHEFPKNGPIFVAPRAQVCLRIRIELDQLAFSNETDYLLDFFNLRALNKLARLAGAKGLLHGVDFHCSPPTAEEDPDGYFGDDWTPTCVSNYASICVLIHKLYLVAGAVFVSFSGLSLENQLAQDGVTAKLMRTDARMATLLNIRKPTNNGEGSGSVGEVEKMIGALRERRPESKFDYAAILVGSRKKTVFKTQPVHPMPGGTWTMMEMIASRASLLQGRIIVSMSDVAGTQEQISLAEQQSSPAAFSHSTVQPQGNETGCWKLSDSEWASFFANLWLKPGDRLAKLLFDERAMKIRIDPDLGEERRVLNFMNEHIIKPMVAHAIRYMGRHCQLPQQFRSSSSDGNHQGSEGSEQLEKLDRSFLIPGTEGYQLLQRVKVHTEFAAEQILGKNELPEDDCAWLSGELSAISAETVAYLVRKAEPLLRNSGFILEVGEEAKNKLNFLLFQLALTMVEVNIELATRALVHYHNHDVDTPSGVVALRDSIDDPLRSPFAVRT